MVPLIMDVCSLSKQFNIKPGETILLYRGGLMIGIPKELRSAVHRHEYALVFIAANSGEEYISFDGNQGDR
jgi:hypothetical protein